MTQQVRQLEPQILWNHFEDLNVVPRPSKKEEKVRAFMRAFGEKLQLEVIEDAIGNIIVKKPATPGMENKKTAILQAHLDMVHQKNSDVVFDFSQQGIQSWVDGDWVKAKGTTLGSDNGIGVAAIMSVLASKEIAHGAIEALFTIDEETGMTGAFALKSGVLTGEVLLNLDSEEDDELCVGCAGGVEVLVKHCYAEEALPAGYLSFQLVLRGLKGGHSGVDIHLNRGNANKIMNRLLTAITAQVPLRIAAVNGGSLRNAIPRESTVNIAIPAFDKDKLLALVAGFEKEIKIEFTNEEKLTLSVEAADKPVSVMDALSQNHLLKVVYACPNGVVAMSRDIPGLVDTSNNLARVIVANGEISIQCLARSNNELSKNDLMQMMQAVFDLVGAKTEFKGNYPGWKPNLSSSILKVAEKAYTQIFASKAKIMAIHAGLECGIIAKAYPDLDMISFGPTIKYPHSPDEKVQISSVQKFWVFLQHMLKNVPVK